MRVRNWPVALCLALVAVPAFAKEDKVDRRSIRRLGNHRASWDGTKPIYYWSNLGRDFIEHELSWVFTKWSEYTPLRFVYTPDRKQCEASRRCIKFLAQGKMARCASSIGRQYYVESQGSDADPGYRCSGANIDVNPRIYCRGGRIFGRWLHGAMLHEVGHALGLFHEHQRYDRDLHIEVYPDRVKANGFLDVVPTHRAYRIDRSANRKVLMPMATVWGPYNPRSIMHYWRKHKTNNALPTLKGAPSLFAFHMTKLQGSDVANVLAANFPKSAFLIDRDNYSSKERAQVDVGGKGLWRSVPARLRGAKKSIAVRSMVIPAGVELKVHNGKKTRRFVPGIHKSDFPAGANFLFRPAASLFAYARYNAVVASLDIGYHSLPKIGLVGPRRARSMVLGSGLAARACFGQERDKASSWKCRSYSSRPIQYLEGKGPLRSLEISLAVSVWDDVNFRSRRDNDPRGVESFVAGPNGQRAKYKPSQRKQLSSSRNRSLYAPPGLAAKICPYKKKKDCEVYSNEGVSPLPAKFFDKKIDIRVYPALNLFGGPHFEPSESGTVALRHLNRTISLADLGIPFPGSAVLGPGIVARLCADREATQCCTLSGNQHGARFSKLQAQCSVAPRFVRLEKQSP